MLVQKRFVILLFILLLCIQYQSHAKLIEVYVTDFNMDPTNISTNNKDFFKRKAKEPDIYVNMEKKCNLCGQSNIKFKFLNNKKIDQPRYQCLDCTLSKGKPHFFNPFPIRKYIHNGYAKLLKVETDELKKLSKVCDKCYTINNATFRGYNNGNVNQPRYACKACKRLFSPLKNSKPMNNEEDGFSNEFQAQSQEYLTSHEEISSMLQEISSPYQWLTQMNLSINQCWTSIYSCNSYQY